MDLSEGIKGSIWRILYGKALVVRLSLNVAFKDYGKYLNHAKQTPTDIPQNTLLSSNVKYSPYNGTDNKANIIWRNEVAKNLFRYHIEEIPVMVI